MAQNFIVQDVVASRAVVICVSFSFTFYVLLVDVQAIGIWVQRRSGA